jgi:hypothetical protein
MTNLLKTNPMAPDSNVVGKMLHGPSCPGAGCYGDPCCDSEKCEPLAPAGHCFEQAMEEGCCDTMGSCYPWYGSVTALVMGRNRPNRLWTSYETGNDPNQLPLDASLKWRWGGEIRFGRRFCCGCDGHWALEASYWTLDPLNSMGSLTHPSTVSTPLVVSGIEFGGINGTYYFDNAQEHRLWRYNEVHSVELNLIRRRMLWTYDMPWDIDWVVGIRYFRFKDRFIFGSRKGATWGEAGGTEEAYLQDEVTNDLLGFQFGFDANYHVGCSWRLFLTPKMGIYNNHIDNSFHAYRGDGAAANPTVASGQTGTFPVEASKDVVSFLTQIDVGAEWQFASRWSARMGYRVVAVTDVGLADNQIPPYVVDIPEIANIDHNANLILHGAFAGLTYNF